MKRTDQMEHAELMEHIFFRIESNESNVTIIETIDPMRETKIIDSLIKKLSQDAMEFKIKNNINQPTLLMNYDMFDGGYKYELSNHEPIRVALEDQELSERLKAEGVQGFIRYADKLLKSLSESGKVRTAECRVFITISGIRNEEDFAQLDQALYNWSLSKDIWDVRMDVGGKEKTIRNHVFVFMPSFSFVSEHTKMRCICITPPLSTYLEREAEYIKKQKDFSRELKLNITPTLINASAALTLHQTETSIYLSLKQYAKERMKCPKCMGQWKAPTILELEEKGMINCPFCKNNVLRPEPLSLAILSEIKKDMIERNGILKVEDTTFGFERVGGYQEVKRYIQESIIAPIQNPKEATEYGIEVPRGIIFAGPGGTGKSLIVRAMAKELNLNLLSLHYPSLLSEYVGKSERNLDMALRQAEASAPCLLGIEEIDFLGDRRAAPTEISSGGGDTSGRMFSQLLEYLGREDKKAILVATTNMPEKLDEDFLRSGRIDVVIPMLYPDTEARKQIFEVHTRIKRKVPIKEEEYEAIRDYVVLRTMNYTGADIEELVKRAAREAYINKAKQVSLNDFKEILDLFNIDMKRRAQREDEFLKKADRLCSDKRFLNQIRKRSENIKTDGESLTYKDSRTAAFKENWG